MTPAHAPTNKKHIRIVFIFMFFLRMHNHALILRPERSHTINQTPILFLYVYFWVREANSTPNRGVN